MRAANAYLPWLQFQQLRTPARRKNLLSFFLDTDDAAWTPELRAEAVRGLQAVRERMSANTADFRPDVVALVDQLLRRLGG